MVQKSSNTEIFTLLLSGTSLLSFFTLTSNGPSPLSGNFSFHGSPTSNFWSLTWASILGGATNRAVWLVMISGYWLTKGNYNSSTLQFTCLKRSSKLRKCKSRNYLFTWYQPLFNKMLDYNLPHFYRCCDKTLSSLHTTFQLAKR